MLPLRFRSIWLACGVALVLAVIVGSLEPGAPSLVPGHDKIQHALAYAVLMTWFAGILEHRRHIPAGLALIAMGIGIEYLQGLPAIGRDREWLDALANSAGVAIGLGLAWAGLAGWSQHVESWLGSAHERG
jgi:hypothetical protein